MQVFIGEAGKSVQHDPALLKRRLRQVVPRQFVLSAAWIVVVNLLAGWLFPIAFGEQWNPAIPYLRALSLAYLAVATLHPVSTSLQIMERQALAAVWQAGRLVLVVSSVIVPWKLGLAALPALWLTSIAQVMATIVMLALIAVSVERIQRRAAD